MRCLCFPFFKPSFEHRLSTGTVPKIPVWYQIKRYPSLVLTVLLKTIFWWLYTSETILILKHQIYWLLSICDELLAQYYKKFFRTKSPTTPFIRLMHPDNAIRKSNFFAYKIQPNHSRAIQREVTRPQKWESKHQCRLSLCFTAASIWWASVGASRCCLWCYYNIYCGWCRPLLDCGHEVQNLAHPFLHVPANNRFGPALLG